MSSTSHVTVWDYLKELITALRVHYLDCHNYLSVLEFEQIFSYIFLLIKTMCFHVLPACNYKFLVLLKKKLFDAFRFCVNPVANIVALIVVVKVIIK